MSFLPWIDDSLKRIDEGRKVGDPADLYLLIRSVVSVDRFVSGREPSAFLHLEQGTGVKFCRVHEIDWIHLNFID